MEEISSIERIGNALISFIAGVCFMVAMEFMLVFVMAMIEAEILVSIASLVIALLIFAFIIVIYKGLIYFKTKTFDTNNMLTIIKYSRSCAGKVFLKSLKVSLFILSFFPHMTVLILALGMKAKFKDFYLVNGYNYMIMSEDEYDEISYKYDI